MLKVLAPRRLRLIGVDMHRGVVRGVDRNHIVLQDDRLTRARNMLRPTAPQATRHTDDC